MYLIFTIVVYSLYQLAVYLYRNLSKREETCSGLQSLYETGY